VAFWVSLAYTKMVNLQSLYHTIPYFFFFQVETEVKRSVTSQDQSFGFGNERILPCRLST